ANPGEFTLRAFLNGRIDLTQAESVLEIVNSQTEKSLEISLRKLKGEFSEKINKIREDIFDLLTNIEAKIDFPEEEDVSSYSIDIKRRVEKIKEEVERIIEKAGKGKILYEGVKASIVGRANVGKSSILNRLLKEERAIVTEIPGTTRDILQEVINIKGIPVKIIDTAGIRKPKSKIEKMGVEKAIEWMEKSEMNLLVLDGSQRLKKDDEILLEKIKEKAYLIIINKIDLPLKLKVDYLKRNFPEERIVFVSAKTGKGIDKLEDAIYRLICEGYGKIESSEFYINVREEELLKKIRDNLKNITENFDNLSIEVTAEFLKESLKNIDFITGRNFSQEILNNIFSKFCIGK
ncbi:MAG TPA: tRNA uridine-5-carboxymethylaminomethyl(34) synthesis GTPase MnmE, partial [bacterium]|nr:tRNA uridine-5-carboxymethylaminomethyl(34) synthesis GTPase MnmE [bacterium]